MASYPYHAIGSFTFDDPDGRWNETPDSQVMPSFPGVEAVRTSLPGVPGEIPGTIAANMPTTVEVLVYVHATVGGVLPDLNNERISALATNLDALYRGIQGAAAPYAGGASVPLTRYYSASDTRVAYGRFEASSTPAVAAGASYATVSLLFTIPSGTWRGAVAVTPQLTVGSGVALTPLSASTGPIPDSRVVLIGPMTSATVTNAQGFGFKLDLALALGEWTVVDTANWSYRAPSTGTPSPTATATLTGAIAAQGPPLGSALVLTPNAATVPVNVTMAGAAAESRFMVRAMPAYF